MKQPSARLVAGMPGFIYSLQRRVDGCTSMTYVSPGVRDIFGLAPEDVMRDVATMYARIYPQDQSGFIHAIDAAALSAQPFCLEFRVNHPQKGERWMEIHATPELLPDGGMNWHGMITDISECKQTQNTQIIPRDFLNSVLGAIADPVFVKDNQHTWIYLNDAFCKFIGRPLESLLGKTDYNFFPEYQARMFWEKDDVVLSSGQEDVNEEDFTDALGIKHTIVTKKTRHIAADGQKFLIGVIRDISERKRAEEMLFQREREFRTLAENSPDPMFRYDCNCRRVYVNPAACKMFGKAAKELIGCRPVNGAFLDAGENIKLIDVIRRMFDSAETARINLDYAALDGELHDYFTLLVPERDADGRVVTVLAIARDVTDIRRLERRQSQYFAMAPGLFATLLKRTDGSYKMSFVSDGIRDLYGIEPDVVTRNISAFVALSHPDDIDMIFRKARQSANDLIPFHVEYRINHPTKGLRWIECHAMPQCMPDGGLRWDGFCHDITARKKMEEALLLSNKYLAEAQRIGQMGSWALDLVNGRLSWSEEVYRICEISPFDSRASYEVFLNVVHPDDRMAVNKAYRDSLENRADYSIDHRLLFADGRIKYVRECCKTDYDAQGQPVCSTGTIQDITERRESEAALRESEEKLRTLYEMFPLGIAMTDMQGRYLEFNEAFRAICGYPADELKSLDYWTLTPQEYAAKEDEQLKSLASIGRYGPYEKEYLHKDGTRVPIQLNGVLVAGRNGQKYIWSIVEDISNRKRMEVALIEREREFRTLAENSLDTVVRFDRECRFVYVNPEYEKSTGLQLGQLFGKKPTQIPGLTAAEFFQQRVQQVIETGRADEFEYSVSEQEDAADWRLVSIFPELDTEGRVIYIQVLSRNIAALKETQQYLEESRAQLRQLLAHQENSHEDVRKKISWDMHEELLQVLSVLRMYASMLKSCVSDSSVQQTILALISGLDSSTALVRQMVFTLRPPVINQGVMVALEWLTNAFIEQHAEMDCKLTVGADILQMDEKSVLVVFRIVQESLTFIANYLVAAKVDVKLVRVSDDYLLSVSEENPGCRIDFSGENSLSLLGLQERVLAMGGEMRLSGSMGLIIEARLPF